MYVATVYRDNEIFVDTITFDLLNMAYLPLDSSIAVIEYVNGNECAIRVIQGATGSFRLRATSTETFEVFDIEIKALFDF